MWKNNWKIAIRHILKNKTSSAINITGLAIGMAACILMLQFVSFELSYDQFHKNASNIYRVVNDRYQDGKLVQHGTITYSGVSRAMKEDFPDEIAAYSRIEPFSSLIFIYGDCAGHDQFSCNTIGIGQPCEIIANRIMKF